MIKRRDFLRQLFATGAVIGSGTLIGACSGITRADLPETQTAGQPIAILDDTQRRILYYASLAPSGHNSQPWRVRIESANTWIVEADSDRRLPCVDPDNRELILSLGAFAENLSLAAGALGRRTDIEVIANSSHDRDVLRVILRPGQANGDPLRLLATRRTVKHGHLPKEISADDVAALSHQAGGGLFYFPRTSSHGACIREAVVESFRIQAARDDAQLELVHWLRLRNRDAVHHRDGLTPEGMEIQSFNNWYVRHFVSPEDFMKAGFRRKGVDVTAKLAQEGGGWMVLTSSGNRVADLIEAGRRFQRLALAARARNIGIQPMTQLLEEKTGRAAISGNHSRHFFPQFVLRVGYLDRYPKPVSLRRPVEWFVTA
ncbi:Tat pathway signal protein [Desulfosarcina widdelii]|uniref:Tat pathway signal protein n=1 Tax=Desulfosarcina widdelii TaxID=947919 RepID=A0A5K7Z592_9BACT|nr:nitroreductase [Desulfosarcina widdelii]BBO75875.1 Tat pathway signal protein [Desulfosarcina widdelii]